MDCLKDCALIPYDDHTSVLRVKDIVDSDGSWILVRINGLSPDHVMLKTLVLDPPKSEGGLHCVAWNKTNDGLFTSCPAYEPLIGPDLGQRSIFNGIWHWKGPESCRVFIWIVARKALLTNSSRHKRGITNSGRCPIYSIEDESIHHRLHDCALSKNVWN